MPTNIDNFTFDVNYAATNVGVFTNIDLTTGGSSPPPPENFLLLTDGTPLLLTTGTELALA